MKRTFKNLNQVFDACKPHQVTAQEILNERLYIEGKGWSDVKIAPELRESVIATIVDNAGGREITQNRMYSSLRLDRPQHWAIARFLLQRYEKVRNGNAYLSYCAGQDQVWEMKELRKKLAP